MKVLKLQYHTRINITLLKLVEQDFLLTEEDKILASLLDMLVIALEASPHVSMIHVVTKC